MIKDWKSFLRLYWTLHSFYYTYFYSHVKQVTETVKFNPQNFKQIRQFLTDSSAKTYLNSMIFIPIKNVALPVGHLQVAQNSRQINHFHDIIIIFLKNITT